MHMCKFHWAFLGCDFHFFLAYNKWDCTFIVGVPYFKVRKLLTHAIRRLKNRLSHNRPMMFPGIDSQTYSLQPLLKFPIFWIFLDCKVCQEIFCYKCYKCNSYVINVIFPPHVLFGNGFLVLSGVVCVYGFKHVLRV